MTTEEKKPMPEKAKDKKEKPKKPRDKTFGCPDWVEDNVIPLGERGAMLWRHLSETWKGPENRGQLRSTWEKFSPHVKDWK